VLKHAHAAYTYMYVCVIRCRYIVQLHIHVCMYVEKISCFILQLISFWQRKKATVSKDNGILNDF